MASMAKVKMVRCSNNSSSSTQECPAAKDSGRAVIAVAITTTTEEEAKAADAVVEATKATVTIVAVTTRTIKAIKADVAATTTGNTSPMAIITRAIATRCSSSNSRTSKCLSSNGILPNSCNCRTSIPVRLTSLRARNVRTSLETTSTDLSSTRMAKKRPRP